MIHRRWKYAGAVGLGVFSVLLFTLGLHRTPRYIHNFGEEEYGWDDPFVAPVSIENGRAIFDAGRGEPVLLFLYPHGHTREPMAQGPLARILEGFRRRVVTFDVPGAYRSTREPTGDMEDMLRAADETLDHHSDSCSD